MKKVGLFYGKSAQMTSDAGQLIVNAWGDGIEFVDVEVATKEDFMRYDYLILGAATWYDGELPSYWDEMLPEVEDEDLSGKKIAVFGLGDQQKYPQNFVDSIGLLANKMRDQRATIVGFTSPDGYSFEHSVALMDGKFQGLALDFVNQKDLNQERVNQWVSDLKKEFVS